MELTGNSGSDGGADAVPSSSCLALDRAVSRRPAPVSATVGGYATQIYRAEGDEPYALERWHSAESDVRFDQEICGAALEFMAAHQVKTVVRSPGIIGCPHEEGVDYAVGQKCPACPY